MNTTRTYTMKARADAVAETRRRILDAGLELAEEKLTIAINLADVADRAGTTVRTVLRHFGSREGLFDALSEHASATVTEERQAPEGDLGAALRILVDHYERRGDFVLQLLAQEGVDERVARQTTAGRRLHREWVRAVFGPWLEDAGDRRELEDLLVVATDVFTWKLLRRDARMSRARAEERMSTLIRRVLGEEER